MCFFIMSMRNTEYAIIPIWKQVNLSNNYVSQLITGIWKIDLFLIYDFPNEDLYGDFNDIVLILMIS